MRDHSEAGKNKNVDFRVAEESEEVLVKNWVPSSCGIEECGIEVSVG